MARTFTILLAALLIAPQLHAQALEADSTILVEVYNATDGPNWTKQDNWLTGPVETWQGITVEEGRVTGVNFSFTGLTGEVPESIFDLDALTLFSIRENDTQMHFDSRVSQWTSLESISVSGGAISGELDALCGMPALTSITFFTIDLGGQIPNCLADMAIERINFFNANLDEAPLPAFLGDIPTLEILNLSDNNFTGSIPQTFCNNHFTTIDLGQNQLSGEIPPCLDQADQIVQLFLDDNQFTGTVPVEILGPEMSILLLGRNELSGDLSSWPSMPRMKRLEINNNLFEGTFDGAMLAGTDIRILDFGSNAFDSIINFPTFPLLSTLRVNHNALDFDDLEALNPGDANFSYNQQADLGEARTVHYDDGDPLELHFDAGGAITTYQWYLDGVAIDGADESTFSVPSLSETDAGVYTAAARHDSFPDLVLNMAPVHLSYGTSVVRDLLTSDWSLRTNPVSQTLVFDNVETSSGTGIASLKIFDCSGHMVVRKTMNLDGGMITANVDALQPAVYIAVLEQEGTFGRWKFVKN